MMVIDFKYKGSDDYQRPTFKQVDGDMYIGSTEILVPNHKLNLNTPKEITEYFQKNKDQLTFFGYKYNKEPQGGKLKSENINLII